MSCQLSLDRLLRLLVLLGGVFAVVAPAGAAARNILPFGASTWNELAAAPSRQLAVVFTTTDCTHCPKVIEQLAEAIRASRSAARLVVVVMDGAGLEDTLRHDRHYRHADVLYVFSGDGMALRYKVNPEWRGITPYVALVSVSGATRFHSGAPPADALRTFLQAQAGRK